MEQLAWQLGIASLAIAVVTLVVVSIASLVELVGIGRAPAAPFVGEE